MITIPADFDQTHVYTNPSNDAQEQLPVGGHICRIIDAAVEQTRAGGEMLVVYYDIAEGGQYDGYFKARMDRIKEYRSDAPWPGIFRAPVLTRTGKTCGYFKGLITAVEESNTGYSFKAAKGDELTLKGKLVGFNFGEEEYVNRKGEYKTTVKPFYAVSVAHIRAGIQPPPKKVYDPAANPRNLSPAAKEFVEVANDPDLPF